MSETPIEHIDSEPEDMFFSPTLTEYWDESPPEAQGTSGTFGAAAMLDIFMAGPVLMEPEEEI
jgi:hypothetical protein